MSKGATSGFCDILVDVSYSHETYENHIESHCEVLCVRKAHPTANLFLVWWHLQKLPVRSQCNWGFRHERFVYKQWHLLKQRPLLMLLFLKFPSHPFGVQFVLGLVYDVGVGCN